MVNRNDVGNGAFKMLEVIAKEAKNRLGTNARTIQRAMWMVRTSDTSMSSKEFKREVFNKWDISTMYQIHMREDFPEKEILRGLINEAGVEANKIEYGFLLPLVVRWSELDDPIEMKGKDVESLIEEFVVAVVDKRVVTRSRYALEGMSMVSDIVSLDEEVCVRRISEEELWELAGFSPAIFGGVSEFHRPPTLVSENWIILDINVGHGVDEVPSNNVLKDAAMLDIVLASRGRYSIVDIGTTKNFSLGAVGLMRYAQLIESDMGLRAGKRYALDEEVRGRMVWLWPNVKRIFQTVNYMKLPAERLVLGLSRRDIRDAVIDFAIGLEVLLTYAEMQEVGYRFALRGASILGWDGGDKKGLFLDLKKFYKIRSRVVHGHQVKDVDVLRNVCDIGENALRATCWWYLNNKIRSLKKGTELVDGRILG